MSQQSETSIEKINLNGSIKVVDATKLLLSSQNHDYSDLQQLQVAQAVHTILTSVGEDPARDGLMRTPERVAKMYQELLAGYSTNLEELLNNALFDVNYDEMVVVKNIEFFSLCEHHLLPFFGFVHVAYIPTNKVIGLSKIPRLVEMFARRLQVQERLTQQIADIMVEILAPLGVGVVVEGSHLCAMMRGVKKEHSRMITSAMRGEFKGHSKMRDEFMAHLQGGQSAGTVF